MALSWINDGRKSPDPTSLPFAVCSRLNTSCSFAGPVLYRTNEASVAPVVRVKSDASANAHGTRLAAIKNRNVEGPQRSDSLPRETAPVRLPRIGDRPVAQRSLACRGGMEQQHRQPPLKTRVAPSRSISSPTPPPAPWVKSGQAAVAEQNQGKRENQGKGEEHTTKRPSICVFFSKSSAEALSLVADSLGWAVHTQDRDDSNIYWVVSPDHMQQRIKKLRAGQKCSRIPGVHDLARKCSFTKLMTLSQELYPGLFDFYPPTWNIPDDMARLQHALKAFDWKKEAVIVKPDDGAQGDGIFISTSADDLMARLASR